VSKSNRRFYRTIMLGLAALGVLIWAATEQFGISTQEISALLVGTLWVAAGTIGLAALCVLVWIALRKLVTKNDTK
jgi:hypothetical protein